MTAREPLWAWWEVVAAHRWFMTMWMLKMYESSLPLYLLHASVYFNGYSLPDAHESNAFFQVIVLVIRSSSD